MELVGSNVVVAAQTFSPSLLTQAWLVRNRVVREGEFEPRCLFSDALCYVNTRQFSVSVSERLLQFSLLGRVENDTGLVAERLLRLLYALPPTRFVAVGLNFTWHEAPTAEDSTNAMSRRLFFRPEVAPFTFFDAPDARFGGYMSKDYGPVRLKLNVKPIAVQREAEAHHRLQFAFNFHRDLQGERVMAEVEETVAMWAEAKAESRRIALASAGGGGGDGGDGGDGV